MISWAANIFLIIETEEGRSRAGMIYEDAISQKLLIQLHLIYYKYFTLGGQGGISRNSGGNIELTRIRTCHNEMI